VLTSQIVAKVISEGGFDPTSSNVSQNTVLGWVNDVYADMCAESGFIRVTRTLSPTVAGGSQYALADDVVDVRSVRVGASLPYTRMSTEELWEAQAGARFLSMSGASAFAPNFDDAGYAVVEIWPASGGVAIQALCVIVPALLTLSPDSTPKIPADTHKGLMEGTIGLGIERIYERPDLAAPHTAKRDAAVQKLQRRANTRVGSGPVQAKIKGVHF
jgi:hypothetical protein